MKKTYKIDVDCANCANKMEEAAKKTAGVKDATVNFMMLKMIVEFEEGLITSRRDGKEVYYKAAETDRAQLLHHMIEDLVEIACPSAPENSVKKEIS